MQKIFLVLDNFDQPDMNSDNNWYQ